MSDHEAKQATSHATLLAELLDSRVPKSEREHAAAAEIERLRVAVEALAYSLRHMEHCVVCATDSWQECAGGRDALAALRLADEAMKERT